MTRIVILDPISDDGKRILSAESGFEVEECIGLKGEELRECLLSFDGAIARSGVKITAESLAGNNRLKAIARAGVGVDNIDTAAATRAGVVVMNTPGGNTTSTAEHTFAMMLALSRNIAPAYQSLIEGRWDRKKFTGNQLDGKTLGIVGMGRIGQVIVRYAKAFGMRVFAADPFFTPARAEEMGVTLVSDFREMLPFLDFLTVHTPLNDQTRGMFGEAELGAVKTGVKLINCARGGIYDLDVLVKGIESGKIGGVALDVYEEEPCTQHPLFGKPNVVCTPHLGASTEEAQTNVALEAAELLVDYFKNGTIRQAVNFGTLDAKTLSGLRGFLNLSFRLGILAAQIDVGVVRACKMKYKGEVARKDMSLVSTSFAAGLLSASMDCEVNIISASSILKDRGIELIEEKTTESGEFSSLITAEVVGDHSTFSFSGTLFGNMIPRLVMVNNYRLDSVLDGNLVLIDHFDRPGVIGGIGAVFGKFDINISSMTVGRIKQSPGGEAIAILALDSEPTANAIKEVNAIPAITKTYAVKLPAPNTIPAWIG
ncbi:MAG: phosphoglycerate dehydrogenase [Planctomycetaceae bacterium]|jgi:D-3-phosphoglycerate dehydrogenase|nr:phosphoglycerate dehydrogenase [Planctomycetaceae bacterium]